MICQTDIGRSKRRTYGTIPEGQGRTRRFAPGPIIVLNPKRDGMRAYRELNGRLREIRLGAEHSVSPDNSEMLPLQMPGRLESPPYTILLTPGANSLSNSGSASSLPRPNCGRNPPENTTRVMNTGCVVRAAPVSPSLG